ncbi:MAG TPA: hypothetical protein VFW40_05220 [Capsulimonadaceae bacterium]|nr:hypothetical protein [Capsulimonadaceae bacterium]
MSRPSKAVLGRARKTAAQAANPMRQVPSGSRTCISRAKSAGVNLGAAVFAASESL